MVDRLIQTTSTLMRGVSAAILVLLMGAYVDSDAHAQQTLLEYDIQGITGFTGTQLSPSTTAADVSATGISFPSNLEVDNGFWEDLNEGLFLVNWDDGGFDINNNYMEFTVEATGGKELVLDNLTLGVGRESTSTIAGPQVFRVYSSLDGYSTPVGEVTLPERTGAGDLTQDILDIDLGPEFDGIEDVTFRIHGHEDVEIGTFPPGGGLAHIDPNGASGSADIENFFGDVEGTGSNVILTGTVFDPAELTLTNAGVSNLGQTSVTFGASIPSDGGLNITERGFVYAETAVNSNPQIGQAGVTQVPSGSGDGAFSEDITGLNEITEYTVRAYVNTSEEGTEYSDTVPFATLAPELARFDIENIDGFSASSLSPASTHPDIISSDLTYATNLSIDADFWEGAESGIMLVDWEESWNQNNSYFEFQVDPEDGNVMNLTNITIGLGRESSDFGGTGPATFRLYSSIDGFSQGDYIAELELPEVENRLVAQRVMSVLLDSQYEGLEDPVTFRVYGYSGIDLGSDTNALPGGGLSNITSEYEITDSGGETSTVSFDGSGSDVIVSGTVETLADSPTVSTATPTSITTNSATLGGNVTDDGGAAVTERGVVYSTDPDPDTGDNVVQIGSGTGSFSQNITGLSPGTTYYVRAYATNSEDTAFGTQQSFTTQVNVASINRQSPSEQLTNSSSVVYEVNLTGPVSGLGTSNFSVNESGGVSGASVSEVSGSGSTYQVTVDTGSGDGSLRLDLDNTTGVSPSITSLPYTAGQSYTIDKTAPEITSITAQQTSPTNETDLEFELVFSEDVQEPEAGDFDITNGSFSSISGSGDTWTLIVNPDDTDSEATITVDVLENGVEDLAGNALGNSATETVDYDGVPPTVALSSNETSPTNADPIPVEIDFSEDVTGFEEGDIVVDGGAASDFAGSGSSYSVDITPDDDGTITVDVDAGVAQDEAGNDNEAASQFNIVSNTSQPTVTVSTDNETTNLPVIPITITFSEEMDDFTHNHLNVDGGSVDSGSFDEVSTGVFEVNIIPQNTSAGQNYDIIIDIPENATFDLAGNGNLASDDLVIDYDTTPLTVEIASDEEEFTNESSFDATISFNKPAPDFAIGDITESNATLSNFSANAEEDEFTVTVSPDSEGEVTLDVAADVTQDAAGNNNEAAQQFSIIFDETAPTPVVSTTASSNTNTSPIPVEIDFGEPVIDFTQSLAEDAISAASGTGFSIEDFDSDAEDEVFTFNLIPDADDTFTIELAADVVTDRAGNENLVSNEIVVTYNTSRPEITFRAVEEGGQITDDELESPTSADFFTLFMDFGEELQSFNQSDIGADNASLDNFATVNLSEGIYEVRVEPDADGEITITVAEGAVQDVAGNDNEEGQFQITSDRGAPTVSSIERADGVNDPTNQSPFDIEITFNQEIADFDESELSVTNGLATGFSTSDNTTFTVEITPDDVTTSSSTLEIGIPAGVFTDLAGNENEADSESFTIEFGDTRPTAELTSNESDPTNADDFEVTLTVTEIFGQAVSSIDASDFALDRAQITDIDATTNPEFVLTVEPLEDGELSVQLNENVLSDAAGNQNEASNEFTITYDNTTPEVVISSDESDPTNADQFEVEFTFDQPVFGFESGDIIVDNATLSDFAGNDGDFDYSVMVTPDDDGLVTVDVPTGVAEDEAGNGNEAADQFSIVFDQTAPEPVVSTTASSPTSTSPIPVEIDFGEPVAEFTGTMAEAAVSPEDGTSFNINDLSTDDEEVFTFNLLPDDDDVFTIQLAADVTEDLAGNSNEASNELSVTFSTASPVVTTDPASDVTSTTADVSGSVNPSGFSTDVTFEYFVTDDGEGTAETVNAVESPLTGDTDQAISASLSDLLAGTEYTVRVVATNENGTTQGNEESFTTEAANITVSDGSTYTPPPMTPGTNDNPVGRIAFEADAPGAALAALTFTLDGANQGVESIDLWVSSSDTFDDGEATQVKTSSQDPSTTTPDVITYDFNSPAVGTSATYVFMTVDLESGAVGDLQAFVDNTGDITFSGGTLTGDPTFPLMLSDTPAPLPVELTAFNTTIAEDGVHLVWETASETNNAGFHIERLVSEADESNAESPKPWDTVDFVEGSGTTDSPQAYSFRDADVPFGAETLSYRLKQVDVDGTATYSDERVIEMPTPDVVHLHTPFPNPAQHHITLRYELPEDAEVELRIYDLLGRQIERLDPGSVRKGASEMQVSTSHLAPGSYFLRMRVGAAVETRRFTVVR